MNYNYIKIEYISHSQVFIYYHIIIAIHIINMNIKNYDHELSLFHKELQRIQKIPTIESNDILCAKELSDLVKMNLLSYEDIINNPKKFFAFHEAISEYNGLEGFGVRFTVQHNLYAGSIMSLGTESHKEFLINSQQNGDLGCFMLTEYNSGVLSGMLCNTAAILSNNNELILNTEDVVMDEHINVPNFEESLN